VSAALSIESPRRTSRFRVVALLLAAGILALHVYSLVRYPPPFVDEAWAANRSWALLTEGVAFGGLDAGVFQRYTGYWTYFPLIPTAIQAVPLWLAGEPLLWPLRVTALGFGLLLLVSCFLIGRSIHGPAVGALSAGLTALSLPFIYSAHLARWDIIVAALGYSALAIQLLNRGRRVWRAAVAGLLVGLAFEIHPHASIFVPVAFVLYAAESRWRMAQRRDVWGWIGGLVAGACVYLSFHVLPYPESFIALAKLGHGPTHTPPIATLDLAIIVRGFVDAVSLMTGVNPFWFAAFVCAAVWLLLSPPAGARLHLLLVVAVFCSLAVLVRNKFGYYAIYATPVLDLTIATFAVEVLQPRRRFFPNPLAAAIVGTTLAIGLGMSLSVTRVNGTRDFNAIVGRLTPLIAHDDVVIGSQTYWFALTDRRYYSWEQLVYYKRYYPSASLDEAFREFKPDILILDGHLENFVKDRSDEVAYSGHLTVPKKELFSFLERHASLIDEFDGATFGRIRVFRIDWGGPLKGLAGRAGSLNGDVRH
jgi:hypothetical protein